MLCAIAAQPSAAPQRRSIADRATAIYGVKRLPGEAACGPPPPALELPNVGFESERWYSVDRIP